MPVGCGCVEGFWAKLAMHPIAASKRMDDCREADKILGKANSSG